MNASLDMGYENIVLNLIKSRYQGSEVTVEVPREADIFSLYGLDSMDVLEFTLELSETLDIEFGESIDDIDSLVDYGSLLDRVKVLLESKTDISAGQAQ